MIRLRYSGRRATLASDRLTIYTDARRKVVRMLAEIDAAAGWTEPLRRVAPKLAPSTGLRSPERTNSQVDRWALRGSNPRPSPCKGEMNVLVGAS